MMLIAIGEVLLQIIAHLPCRLTPGQGGEHNINAVKHTQPARQCTAIVPRQTSLSKTVRLDLSAPPEKLKKLACAQYIQIHRR